MSTRFQDYNPQTPITAEWLNAVDDLLLRAEQSVSSVAALRQVSKLTSGPSIETLGYYVPGDSGGGNYYLDLADVTSPDNGGTVIVASDGGRWKLDYKLSVRVRQFGAKGDGVTIDTAAVLNANQALPLGGQIYFDPGTYIIDTDACLTVGVPGITVKGEPNVSIIKARDGANLSNLIGVLTAGTGCTVVDLVLDGNRANSGLSNAVSYGINATASHFRCENVDVRECTRIGAFIGSGSAIPRDMKFINSRFYNNGGLIDNTGIGVGIYGGGTFLPDNVVIDLCTFENNFNTVAGFPGDSTGINITARNVTVVNSTFKNNHNVQGGQLALTSDGSTGAPDGNFIVIGNRILHDITVAGENTTAIEIEGRKAIVSNNFCQSLNGDGVRLETSGGDSIVGGNEVDCTATGVNLIQVGGAGPRKVLAKGNHIFAASIAFSSQGNPGGVQVVDNYIDASIPTPFAGLANMELVRGNFGFQPGVTLSIPAGGPSPYEFPKLNYDAFYVLVTANGLVSHNVYGVNVSISLGVPIPVKAGQTFSVFYAGAAPVYSICPQQ